MTEFEAELKKWEPKVSPDVINPFKRGDQVHVIEMGSIGGGTVSAVKGDMMVVETLLGAKLYPASALAHELPHIRAADSALGSLVGMGMGGSRGGKGKGGGKRRKKRGGVGAALDGGVGGSGVNQSAAAGGAAAEGAASVEAE